MKDDASPQKPFEPDTGYVLDIEDEDFFHCVFRLRQRENDGLIPQDDWTHISSRSADLQIGISPYPASKPDPEAKPEYIEKIYCRLLPAPVVDLYA